MSAEGTRDRRRCPTDRMTANRPPRLACLLTDDDSTLRRSSSGEAGEPEEVVAGVAFGQVRRDHRSGLLVEHNEALGLRDVVGQRPRLTGKPDWLAAVGERSERGDATRLRTEHEYLTTDARGVADALQRRVQLPAPHRLQGLVGHRERLVGG